MHAHVLRNMLNKKILNDNIGEVMGKRRVWLFAALLVILISLPSIGAIYLDVKEESFSISIDPKKSTAKPGDEVSFTIDIHANGGFNDSIALVLEVEALSHYEFYDLGYVDPPYPKQIQRSLTLPEEVPASVTAYGTITASSMDLVVTEEVQITIKSGNIIGDIIGWVLGIIQAIIDWFSSLFG